MYLVAIDPIRHINSLIFNFKFGNKSIGIHLIGSLGDHDRDQDL